MNIEIKQRKFNFLQDRYEVQIDGEAKYEAKSKLLTLLPKIGVYDLNKKELLTIQKRSENIVELNYSLKFPSNHGPDINTDSMISFSIRISSGSIHFYEQKNNLIGIFHNENQIGIIDKNQKVLFDVDQYSIKMDKGIVNELLVIGFVIAYDFQFNNNKSAFVNYDWGNVAIEPVKVIDPDWKVSD